MMTVDEFVAYVMEPDRRLTVRAGDPGAESRDVEDAFDFFGDAGGDDLAAVEPLGTTTSFAKYLLELQFGSAEKDWPLLTGDKPLLPSLNVEGLRALLPGQAQVWDRHTATAGPEYVILLEFAVDLTARQLFTKAGPLFRQLGKTERVEDALDRVAQTVLAGVRSRGASKGESRIIINPNKVLCVVSICDDRCTDKSLRLVSFATLNQDTDGFETFQLHEEVRTWDMSLAREHLQAMFRKAFDKLSHTDWQQAFTTTEERKQAQALLETCTLPNPTEHQIQESVLDMLDIIAKGFGLRKKAGATRRLQEFPLPADHDIGIDAEERVSKFDGENPFGGVTLRDERSRLLGYIVYPLKDKADADRLRTHLAANNRFHNVLVVYPDKAQASLELWQGREQLTGKLRKDQGYKDAADVVNLLSRFFVVSKAKVRNPAELAQELAYRARYLRRLAVMQLAEEKEGGPLRALYQDFTKVLVGDLKEDEFADAFAQTLTYSLLTARWVMAAQGEASADRFTRKAAMQRLSVGSRFLSEMFNAVLSMNLEDLRARLLWLVDDIADLLDRIDVVAVFKGDGGDATADPVIHFYEPFLQAYDAKIRIQRGAFYTPQPVVSYIVRSVHELLQTEFKLDDGLADTATWGDMLKRIPGLKLPKFFNDEGDEVALAESEPFVQILDPATGTGTFLVEVIEVVHRTLLAKWQRAGMAEDAQKAEWNRYVPKHLLPRLHAFELMMAPYAIAHMKIGLKLAETGYRFGKEERARIFLTNALEPWVREIPLIGFEALAHEAAAVNDVKRFKRFTVVVGNPPYSGISANMSTNAVHLVDAYKMVDGVPLGERKLWLQDDYVKFMRLAEILVQQATSGVTGLITPHGYAANPTFRGMRRSLMLTFPMTMVLDLHGNANRKERSPDGSEDKNVFDIKQGVAIFIGSKSVSPKSLGYAGIWGAQLKKYAWLATSSTATTDFSSLSPDEPFYLFMPQNTDTRGEYNAGWKITDAMPVNSAGFITARDHFVIDTDSDILHDRIMDFSNPEVSDEQIRLKYFEGCGSDKYPNGDTRGWKLPQARKRVMADPARARRIQKCLYRPFDDRYVYWTEWMVDWPRPEVMGHMLAGENLAILTARSNKASGTDHFFCSKYISETKCAEYSTQSAVFPLYTFRSSTNGLAFGSPKEPNLDATFLQQLAVALDVEQSGPFGLPGRFTEVDIFNYCYSVMHSPEYRSRYAEFLKIDFPRIPLPGTPDLFSGLARLGRELAEFHLMEAAQPASSATTRFLSSGETVQRIGHSEDTVWIDFDKKEGRGSSGFQPVPEAVWNFHIGGYQVCEKWLKDRKGRTLTPDDITHYKKIITAITETIRIMAEIDEVIEAHGGWPDAFVTAPPEAP